MEPYVKTVYVNDSAPAISAENLNKSEDGIFNVVALANNLKDSLYNNTYWKTITSANAELVSGTYRIFLDVSSYGVNKPITVYDENISDGSVSTYWCSSNKSAAHPVTLTFSNHFATASKPAATDVYLRLPATSSGETASVVESAIGFGKRITDAETNINTLYDDVDDVNTELEFVTGEEYASYTSALSDGNPTFIPTSKAQDYDNNGMVAGATIKVRYPIAYANSSVTIGQRAEDKSAIGQITVSLNAKAEGTFTVIAVAYYYTFYLTTGQKIEFISSKTMINRIEDLEDSFDDKLHYKGLLFENASLTLDSYCIYEQCVFKSCTLTILSNCNIYNCDLVNSIIFSPFAVNFAVIKNNRFIGRNARIQIHEIADCIIDGNDFLISDTTKYPNAQPKTTGEESRNIFVYSMNRCKIINNYIRIGRTGICCLGDNDRLSNANTQNISSCDNVISNNFIGGIGEEHISFDGGALFDVGKITNISVSYKDVDTGQLIDNSTTTNQIKKVAVAEIDLETQLVGTYLYPDTKHVKKYPNVLKGIFAVALKNSKYYEMTSLDFENSAIDPEDNLEYSTDGSYKITIEIPTIYSNINPITPEGQASTTAGIISDWSIGDVITLSAIQARNIISNNTIEGIGTDTISNASDMGGIVLYGICLNNVISNNHLHQKRIWLINWNNKSASYKSKIKMQSYNVISNNTLFDTAISLNKISVNEGFVDYPLCLGNILISNSVVGTNEVAGIMVDNFKNTKLIGNTARCYRLRNCDGLMLVANTKETSGSGAYFYDNTNVKADSTDEIQS